MGKVMQRMSACLWVFFVSVCLCVCLRVYAPYVILKTKPHGVSHRRAFRGDVETAGSEAVIDSLSSLRLPGYPRRSLLARSDFPLSTSLAAAPLLPRILSAVQARLGPGAHHGGQEGGVP